MAYRSSSLLTGASRTTAQVPVPSGAASGDIAVVGLYLESAASVTPPSGFTLKSDLNTSPTARGRLAVYWKRLTAGDAGTYDFSWTGAAFSAAVCSLHTGRLSAGDPFDGTVGTNETTVAASSAVAGTTPTLLGGDGILIATNFNGGGTWTAATNYTERQDTGVITLDTRDGLAAASTGNIGPNCSVSDFMKGFTGVLAPDNEPSVLNVYTSSRANGTTTLLMGFTSSNTSGRLGVVGRAIKPSTATGTAESGWTPQLSATGGTGAAAIDAGTTRIVVDTREYDATEGSSVTFDQGTSPNSVTGALLSYEHAAGLTWDIVTTSGDDSTHGTGRSATGSAIDLAPEDVLVAFVGSDTDATTAFTSPSITASGITFSAVTERLAPGGNSAGNDVGLSIYEATVESGSGTVAPSLSLSSGPSNCGPVAFVRLRGAGGGGGGDVTGSGDVTAPAATASGAGTISLTGSGTGTAAAATGSGSATIRLTGSGSGTAAAATGSSSGTLSVAGSGAATAPAADADGTGALSLGGSGAATAPAATGSGAGSVGSAAISGTGSVTAPAATGSAAGAVSLTGSGTATAPAATGSGSGSVGSLITGAGAGTAAAATASGSGTLSLIGAGTATASAPTVSAAGTLTLTGSATAAAAPAMVAADGTIFDPSAHNPILGPPAAAHITSRNAVARVATTGAAGDVTAANAVARSTSSTAQGDTTTINARAEYT